ncbi:MAG TPA: prepilin-type N-terminal cleavage/methylation domain-containing protein [Candidatus Sulfotelmatobacter sp.]|nr:prepilin-type N-terminal cleavage/methylation domain-containing protein [Candidatus Sulfotelmatobacter sp.]
MKKQKGFSLIELLIVVAIILIIAAIAIPNLIRSKMAANEASAVASLRTINTGEVTYNNTYPGTFATMGQLGPGAAVCGTPAAAHACLIDNLLANATTVGTAKSGYVFLVTAGGAGTGTYTSEAEPATAQTGTRGFCSDQNLVLFYLSVGVPGVPAGSCTTANTPL